MINKRLVIILSAVVLVPALVLFSFWYSSFRLIGVEPGLKIPPEASKIEFIFNRDLKNDKDTSLTFSRDIKGEVKIKDNKITFIPSSRLNYGNITARIKNIKASNGSEIKSITKNLNVAYMEFRDLSEEEQRQQVNSSGSGQEDYPIINGTVPYVTASYGIGYVLPDEYISDKLTLTFEFYMDQGTNEPLSVYQERLEAARAEAVKHITDAGYVLSDYYLRHYNTYLAQKYDVIPDYEGE